MNDRKENNHHKPVRVGIYLRLSNEDKDKIQKEEDSESIKNQRNMLIDYIDRHSEFILIDEYCDEDLSGAGTFRPQFERLIQDCENRKLDIVLCKSQSRFSRDMEIVEKYLHNKFKEWNVRFIGLSDNADTEVLGNKKARQINGLVNEWYLEDVSNNIRSAFYSKMKQGEFISPFAAYGYEISINNNNQLIIDPVASEIVKEIYLLYLKGVGFTGIAKYLNEKKVPSPSFYKYLKGSKLNIISNRPRDQIKWNTNAIKTILTNELYIGHLIQGKRTTISYKNHHIQKKNRKDWIRKENTHQAIIDKNTFQKVQMAIKERTKPIKKTNMVHLFSGKVFCLECTRYMRKKNSTLHEYLVCSNNKDGYNDCINQRSIRYDVLEKLVLEAINTKIQKYYDEKFLMHLEAKKLKEHLLEQIHSLEKQKLEIRKKKKENTKYLKALYEDKVNQVISHKQFTELASNYNSNDMIYNSQIQSIDDKIHFYKQKELSAEDNKKILKKYKSLAKLNRVVVDEFIDKIYIGKLNEDTKTRVIEIQWNLE